MTDFTPSLALFNFLPVALTGLALWVLALNGPGANPGTGWALSHCGEFWLRLEGGYGG